MPARNLNRSLLFILPALILEIIWGLFKSSLGARRIV
jgi:hypothetical protein